MPRRTAALLAALVGAGLLGPVGLTAGPAGAAVEPGTDPLQVEIESLSPAVVPQRGPVRVTGRVTNLDEVTWTTVNLYGFVTETPMRSAGELAAAAEQPAEEVLGRRIADPEFSATVDEIAPGDTVSFSFEVPRAMLGLTEPGVYRFGVQALGQGPEGRDLVADGRSLTFLPLVPPATEPLPTAFVVPLRRQVQHTADGRVDDVADWARTLGQDGRLRSLVDLGASADTRAVTWLVDPAVVDAARRLAAGNPPRSLDPTVPPEEPTEPEETDPQVGAAADPGDPALDAAALAATGAPQDAGATDADGSGASSATSDSVTTAAQQAAADWLSRLGRALPGHQVLGLPYGDVDVAGAADASPATYAAARERTGTVLGELDVPLVPVVASPGGYLDRAGLDLVEGVDTVLVSAAALPAPDDGSAGPSVLSDGPHRVVVTSTASAAGTGPGPGTLLSLRQRMAAEAAVRVLSDDPEPLVTVVPPSVEAAGSSGFFSGLDVDWLDLRPVGDVAGLPASSLDPGDLVYPRAQEGSEISRAGFDAATALTRAGEQLQQLLARNDRVGGVLRDEALSTVSYSSRSSPVSSRLAAAAATRWVDERLEAVHIDAPTGVTMTGTEGRFSATVVNDLPQPVTVALRARTGDGLSLSQPRAVDIPASGRARVLLVATAPRGGIHTVQLTLDDTSGAPLGGGDRLTVRSLMVSNVIWLFMGAAGVLLAGAIVFRLARRLRAARAARAAARA